MDKYDNYMDYDLNVIRTILEVDYDIKKDRINTLISLLDKKLKKRYNPSNKVKDNQKMLLKYRTTNRRNSDSNK